MGMAGVGAARHPVSRFYQPLWVGLRAIQHPDFINHYGFQVLAFRVWILVFGGFGFQTPNAIDKLKIGALQRANFKLVNCLKPMVPG